MKLRLPIVALLVLHTVGWIAAAVQSVLLQVGQKGISDDAILFGTTFGLFAVLSAALTFAVAKGWRPALIVLASVWLVAGTLLVLVGVPMLVLGLSGPADPYIAPMGGLGSVLGAVHFGAGILCLVAWLRAKRETLERQPDTVDSR